MNDLQKKISRVLLSHHILPNKKGYFYLAFIIELMLCESKSNLKQFYNLASNVFGVRNNTIEKCIANVIEKSFSYIDMSEKYGDLTSTEKGKLTNKQFFDLLITQIANTDIE